jgi:uncharacterized protein YfkK (UPF0435 family)
MDAEDIEDDRMVEEVEVEDNMVNNGTLHNADIRNMVDTMAMG